MGFKYKTAKGHRVFFALPVASDVTLAIEHWRSTLPVLGRLVPPNNFHITLAFLGEIESAKVDTLMNVAFSGFRPFSLAFGQLGYFAKSKVLFLAPNEQPDALLALAQRCAQLQQQWGNAKKEARFQAHITLARDVEASVSAAPLTFTHACRCDTLVLYESHQTRTGVQYSALAQWPLQGSLRPQPR